jgi:hypothetical protein
MHTCEYFDVMEQTRAAEEVAPEGFKIHWDFNANRTLGAVLPIIGQLEKHHPIVGYIEDPLLKSDMDGWRRLREKIQIPIIMHGAPLGSVQEIIGGVADAYILPYNIGDGLVSGFVYGRANVQTIMQLTGGSLTKALALHMAAVLPTATGHSINLDDQYEEDITTEQIPVSEGHSPVPEGPGLGLEVDEGALARLAANEPNVIPKHVSILHLPGGHKVFTPPSTARGNALPDVSRMTGREEGTIRGLRLQLWEDDGSPEFERVYERVQAEGSFVE